MFTIESRHDAELVARDLAEWQRSKRALLLRLAVQRDIKAQTGSADEDAIKQFEKGLEACEVAIRYLMSVLTAAQNERATALTAPLNGNTP